MKSRCDWAFLVLLIASGSEAAQHNIAPAVSQERVLEFGKSLDVATLDSRLHSEQLGPWFFALIGPKADLLQWKGVPCGLLKEAPPQAPFCVRGEAAWREGQGSIIATIDIEVGTMTSQLATGGKVFAVTVRTEGGSESPQQKWVALRGIAESKLLSDLPRMMQEAADRLRR